MHSEFDSIITIHMGSFFLCNCSGYGKWAQLLPLHAFPCSQMRIIIFLTADPLKYWICNQYNTSQNKQQIKSRLFVYIIVPLFNFLCSQKSPQPRWDECKFLSSCQSIEKREVMIMHFKSLSCLLIAQNQLTNQLGSENRVKKYTKKIINREHLLLLSLW